MKKIHGEERRQLLLQLLKSADQPYTGSNLANRVGVSRQVIVNDMNLLKATGEPILSTSQGYLYIIESEPQLVEKKIVCRHTPEQTIEELYAIVDCGATVKDLTIDHPVYGEITVSMYLSNRFDVDIFLNKVHKTNAPLLSQLTNGTHVHTITAKNEQPINNALDKLRQIGILVEH